MDKNCQEQEKARQDPSILARAQSDMNQCASESLRSRAMQRARINAGDAVRFERLSELMTPEIENVLFCLQEALSLGLLHLPERQYTMASDARGGISPGRILR